MKRKIMEIYVTKDDEGFSYEIECLDPEDEATIHMQNIIDFGIEELDEDDEELDEDDEDDEEYTNEELEALRDTLPSVSLNEIIDIMCNPNTEGYWGTNILLEDEEEDE